ncbi:MAG: PorT family protein [Candidatus Aminicenantes bacterium]|nr:PorT family protein [Candidatus Aminicenantes bacterium]
MKSRLSFVLALALLIMFCAPGMKGNVNPYFKPQLTLPSLSTQQAPVVYGGAVGYTSFGIKLFGGLSMGTARNSAVEGIDVDQYKKSRMGLVGGIGFETGGQVGAEIDIMYVQKGIVLKGSDNDGMGYVTTFDFNIVLNQISVPVLLRFKFMPGTSPYILLGGSVSYILSATADYNVSDNEGYSETGSEDLYKAEDGSDQEALTRLDYSIVGGGGFELAMGTMRIYFEARYIYGLANILHKTARDDGGANNWVKLSTFLIMGGIGF